MLLIVVLLASVILLSPESLVNGQTKNVNVMDYGAKGDGRTDDTEAFQKVWDDICYGQGFSSAVVLIPSNGKFPVHPIMFKGPCNAHIKVQLEGHIIPSIGQYALGEGNQWVTFRSIDNLEVGGHGSIDGGGPRFRRYHGMKKYNTKKLAEYGGDKPTNVAFFGCKHLTIWGITSSFSQKNHVSISQCEDVVIHDVHLNSPGESQNTDGIDITHSSWVTIKDSDIHTGDDCIEINSGTSNVNISNVFCGPGHGISIGSFKGGESNVEQVHVQHCTFKDTQNGARIKTFPEGVYGYVRAITFEDITLENVKNPIVIDQNYDDNFPLKGSVGINDVKFIGFEGTCSGQEAIHLKCKGGPGCTSINLNNVHIRGSKGQAVTAVCENVQGTAVSTSPEVSCLNGIGGVHHRKITSRTNVCMHM